MIDMLVFCTSVTKYNDADPYWRVCEGQYPLREFSVVDVWKLEG